MFNIIRFIGIVLIVIGVLSLMTSLDNDDGTIFLGYSISAVLMLIGSHLFYHYYFVKICNIKYYVGFFLLIFGFLLFSWLIDDFPQSKLFDMIIILVFGLIVSFVGFKLFSGFKEKLEEKSDEYNKIKNREN